MSIDQTEAIRALTREIPLNDFGLPTGIYRPDMLPFHDYDPRHLNGHDHNHNEYITESESEQLEYQPAESEDESDPEDQEAHSCTSESTNRTTAATTIAVVPKARGEYRIAGFPARSLHTAFVPLQYDEGFPAFNSGVPFWSRLEFEPADAYEVFQKYLHMNLGTPAPTITEDNYDEDFDYDGRGAGGNRSLSELVQRLYPAEQCEYRLQQFKEYYHTYYWGMRAHAYDLYRVAQHTKEQEFRAVETQSEHYVQSRRLRHRLNKYMASDEEFWELMTPAVAVKMFDTVTKLERLSAGLPASAPPGARGGEDGDSQGTPFEVIMRKIAQTHRRADDNEGRVIDESGEILEEALENPEQVKVLQELIIRGIRT